METFSGDPESDTGSSDVFANPNLPESGPVSSFVNQLNYNHDPASDKETLVSHSPPDYETI